MTDWISAKEQLPEEGAEVLVWIPAYGRPLVGYVNWDHEHGWTIEGEPLGAGNLPSLWMPIPSPSTKEPQ